MVNGITFSEQLITSANFAHFMYTFLNHANGITKGCEVSHANGTVYVQKGYFMEFGRMVQVVGTEEIESPDVLSGQLYCTVVFEIDLTQVNTVEEFKQGYFKTLTGTETYPELIKQDLDGGGTKYQMPWCQYIKKTDGISEFRDIREILNLESVWDSVAGQNTEYKKEFDQYFAKQKAEVERMIAELESQGYLLLSTARRTQMATLTAEGWQGEGPYTQTVDVSNVKENDTPVAKELIPKSATKENEKAIRKAAACVSYFETGNGTVTFTCIGKKPATDFQVVVKGV